jgi:DNA-binding NtrC family response regulator
MSANKRTILIVDDDDAILNMLAWSLKAAYDVLTAKDGIDAAYSYEKNGAQISALVTDVDMPRLDGAALAEWVHHINPQLPIIIISGSVQDGTLKEPSQLVPISFLGKPFEPYQLERMLLDALETKAGEAA